MYSTELVSLGLCCQHISPPAKRRQKESPVDSSRVSPSHHQTSISLVFPNNSDIDDLVQPYSLVASSKASKQSSKTSIHTPRFFPRRPHLLPTVQANPYFRVQFHIARKRQPKEVFDSTRASRNPDLVGGNTSKRIGCPAHTPTRQIGQRRAKTSSENIVHQTPKKWQQARNIYGIH